MITENLPTNSAPARCAWEVRAGIIPGTPIPELTKLFGMTSAEYESDYGKEIFTSRMVEAAHYAISLQDPNRVNWVSCDWMWF